MFSVYDLKFYESELEVRILQKNKKYVKINIKNQLKKLFFKKKLSIIKINLKKIK